MDFERIFNNIVDFVKAHKKAVIITIIALILLIIIPKIINSFKTAPLRFSVTPSNATITINGKTYENRTTENFFPGKVTAKLSSDGFESKEVTIELFANKEVKLTGYLLKDGGLDHYTTNKADFISLLNYYNEDINSEKDSLLKDYFDSYYKIVDIKNHLPIAESISTPERLIKELGWTSCETNQCKNAILIREDPDPTCEHFTCLLIIDETERLHDEALDIIKKKGYDPENYQIKWSKDARDF